MASSNSYVGRLCSWRNFVNAADWFSRCNWFICSFCFGVSSSCVSCIYEIWQEIRTRQDGERHYLWRAVDHEGEILESYVTKKRDKVAALAFLKKALKRHGRAETIVTDGLRSYPAAMRKLGNLDRREMGRWKNNRAENSHLPFRRRERAMLRFRRMKSLQKFVSVHASFHNHFNQQRNLVDRQTYKLRRSAALAEWQSLAV